MGDVKWFQKSLVVSPVAAKPFLALLVPAPKSTLMTFTGGFVQATVTISSTPKTLVNHEQAGSDETPIIFAVNEFVPGAQIARGSGGSKWTSRRE